eukprot:TRINITY_DN1187_c0_g2_i1.p2 TRINITY_DN1187_c0_g2~~TRINITY_DN1187_c0_g2_i1.p2  ORF type:complete len:132 (+),score=14.39 TRINITY_DN1187_c0_g2_i1:73-468(+)
MCIRDRSVEVAYDLMRQLADAFLFLCNTGISPSAVRPSDFIYFCMYDDKKSGMLKAISIPINHDKESDRVEPSVCTSKKSDAYYWTLCFCLMATDKEEGDSERELVLRIEENHKEAVDDIIASLIITNDSV